MNPAERLLLYPGFSSAYYYLRDTLYIFFPERVLAGGIV
jgi:hypothetical protein